MSLDCPLSPTLELVPRAVPRLPPSHAHLSFYSISACVTVVESSDCLAFCGPLGEYGAHLSSTTNMTIARLEVPQERLAYVMLGCQVPVVPTAAIQRVDIS